MTNFQAIFLLESWNSGHLGQTCSLGFGTTHQEQNTGKSEHLATLIAEKSTFWAWGGCAPETKKSWGGRQNVEAIITLSFP